jgi:predicted Ser/Thr protein kinase
VTLIGGHEGLIVRRTSEGIRKIASGPNLEVNLQGLMNEARMLRLMEGTGFAPRLYAVGDDWILQEDVGETLQQGADTNRTIVIDSERFRRNCARLLLALRDREIRHGDITAPNIAIGRNDQPIALDWQESHLFHEPRKSKHFSSDSFLLWRTASSAPSQIYPTPDTPRIIRRWSLVRDDLGGGSGTDNLKGKTLLDLGCFMGDFCGMAIADGMRAIGVDRGGFNTDVPDSITEARKLWDSRAQFLKGDILDLDSYEADAVLLFSTWSYIIQEYGQERADDLLGLIVAEASVLYFEMQLYGDGPGPAWATCDDDVHNHLSRFGKVVALGSFPVTGRPATRTIWRVTK